jgi:hypothetical protein
VFDRLSRSLPRLSTRDRESDSCGIDDDYAVTLMELPKVMDVKRSTALAWCGGPQVFARHALVEFGRIAPDI